MEREVLMSLLSHLKGLDRQLQRRDNDYAKAYRDAVQYVIGYIDDALYEAGIDTEEGEQ